MTMGIHKLQRKAYAKINWFLHIIGRRDDGYHLIESVFQLIDLADELELIARQDGKIKREDEHTQTLPEEDLCMRAAHALKIYAGRACGVTIVLKKNIPQQAGLGGGSSNAAATLLGLNQLWQLNLDNKQLNEIGLSLGADVPFFLSKLKVAFVSGIGEYVEALTPMSSPLMQAQSIQTKSIAIVQPHAQLSTQAVFQHYAKHHTVFTASRPPRCLAAIQSFENLGKNDLEPSAMALCLELAELFEILVTVQQRYPETSNAKMSGSGSACFLTHPTHWDNIQKQSWNDHFAGKANVYFVHTLKESQVC